MVTINRLRDNHYNLNESLARKGYIDSARCECGAEVEDVNHVVFSCIRYDEERLELRKELDRLGVGDPLCVWSWIKKEDWKAPKVMSFSKKN